MGRQEDGAGPHQRRGSAFRPSHPRSFRLGAGNGTRTRDPLLGKQMLYQLSYSRSVRAKGPADNVHWRPQTVQRPIRGSLATH